MGSSVFLVRVVGGHFQGLILEKTCCYPLRALPSMSTDLTITFYLNPYCRLFLLPFSD